MADMYAFQIGSALATNVLTYSKYIQGTYHVVETSAERDALTVKTGTDDGIIVKGSLVHVSDDNKTYRWNGTAFVEESTGAAADAWNYRGTVADLDSLPTTATDGEVYTVTANGQNYFAKNEEDPENPGTNIVVWKLVAGYDITALETAIGKDDDGNLVAVTDRIKDEAVNANYVGTVQEAVIKPGNSFKCNFWTAEGASETSFYVGTITAIKADSGASINPAVPVIINGNVSLRLQKYMGAYANLNIIKEDGTTIYYSLNGQADNFEITFDNADGNTVILRADPTDDGYGTAEDKQYLIVDENSPASLKVVKKTANALTIKEKIEALEEEIESKEDTYTNENASTIEVGGIAKGSTFDGKTMKEMWDMLLYPYVAFDFTGFATSDAAGTYEYGTAKTISSGKPTFTAGSKAITSIKITDNDGNVVYEGTTATSGTSYDLAAPIAWDGKSEMTFTCKLSDGETTLTKTAKFAYEYPIYYTVTDNNTTVPTSGTKGNGIDITFTNNTFVWFFSQTTKTVIQQFTSNEWKPVASTTPMGTVTFTLASGATATYNAYVGPKMQASTCKLRIA